MPGSIKKNVKNFLAHYMFLSGVAELHDIELENFLANERFNSHNPLVKRGYRVFSQLDEDGIIQEIFHRLGIKTGVFLELGVGDGTENNTLNLCMKGWRGYWLGGQELIGEIRSDKVSFKKLWITRESLLSAMEEWKIAREKIDFLSIDVDGNDFYFAEIILKDVNPSVICVEYNGLWDYETNFVMKYSATHKWEKDWYFGASILAWQSLLANYQYSLVCCSLNGTNAFFVRNDHLDLFKDCLTESLARQFVPQRNYLFKSRRPVGRRLFEQIVNQP
jgi:hypothetical protein